MELVVVLVIVLLLVMVVLPICTLVSIRGLVYDVKELKELLKGKNGKKEARLQEKRQMTPQVDPERIQGRRFEVLRKIPETPLSTPVETHQEVVVEEPSALDLFWDKVEDWFYVKGSFAPKGTTREFAVATRWLVRVGLAMLIGCIVYFFKLSVDRGWVGPEARVMGTVFWGAIGVAGGVWLVKRTRYGLLGHAAAALGVCALYLGFGLGHRYFAPPVIASPHWTFLFLTLVTIAAGIVSVMLPSSTIAVMGLVGGYLVPVIARFEGGNVGGLCAYLFMLNVGAFVVARRRGWSALDFLAATLAYVMIFCGGLRSASQVWTMFVFLTAVHALYMASVVIGARSRGSAGNALAWTGLSLNAVAYLGWLGTIFFEAMKGTTTGFVFLALVAAYLGVAALSVRCGWMDRASVNILLVFALVYLSLAPVLIFTLPWYVLSWCLIAVAVSEAELRTRQQVLGVIAGILLVAAGGFGLFRMAPELYCRGEASGTGYFVAFLLRMLRVWCLPAAVGFVGWRWKMGPLMLTAAVCAFLFMTGEAHLFGKAFLPSLKGGTVTVAWTLTAFGLLLGGIMARQRNVRLTGLGLLGVSVVKLLLLDTHGLAMPARVGVFGLVGVALMVGAFLYMKFKERFVENEKA